MVVTVIGWRCLSTQQPETNVTIVKAEVNPRKQSPTVDIEDENVLLRYSSRRVSTNPMVHVADSTDTNAKITSYLLRIGTIDKLSHNLFSSSLNKFLLNIMARAPKTF